MKTTVWWLILIVGLGLAGIIVYRAMQGPEIDLAKYPPTPPPTAPAEPTATAPGEPQTHYPLPQASSDKPLPPLEKSDHAIQQALRELWSGNTLERVLQLDDFIRRVVATVDNLPRRKVTQKLLPARQAPGKFLTTGKGESLAMSPDKSLAMSPDNAARYGAYVRMAETVDVPKLVALYIHFYPLFQQAYQDLGYPKGYFNDRLIAAIDDLLATPEVTKPLTLIRPNVLYVFADPELESRSAGQKVMLRMGNENAGRVKKKLREFRGELTRQAPTQ
jgi:hypothetical protein